MGGAFNLPRLTNVFKPTATASRIENYEPQLLRLISNTGNGKRADLDTQASVLSLVRTMETSATPSATLLSNPEEAQILDGDWFLQYTAPSEIDKLDTDDKWVAVKASEGDEKIDTRQFKGAGSVSGGGIPVDASDSVALQSFDIQSEKRDSDWTGARDGGWNVFAQRRRSIACSGGVRHGEDRPERRFHSQHQFSLRHSSSDQGQQKCGLGGDHLCFSKC